MALTYLFLLGLISQCAVQAFRFSTYYQDNMVLQKGGVAKQVVWGKSDDVGRAVHVTITPQGGVPHSVGVTTVAKDGTWLVKLNYTVGSNYGPYNITATSGGASVTLHDVLFGDVWVCSGQSNMYFTVHSLRNGTEEINDAVNHPNIRIFRAALVQSNTSLDEFAQGNHGLDWQSPDKAGVNAFSAVCWLYGKYLYEQRKYPIGLVETAWGGTPVEAWSSPDANNVCGGTRKKRRPPPHTPSVLWNAMVNPLIRTSIYGAIWYQGEANTVKATEYACQFPAMIADWRKKFHAASAFATRYQFPFGFVQLAPNRNGSTHLGFPTVRWSQTANHGTVPNADMPNTFMAVAMDLPDYTAPLGRIILISTYKNILTGATCGAGNAYPYGASDFTSSFLWSIHPRYKHEVASRLALSAMAVAYHQTGFDYQGPFPSSFRTGNNSLIIEYNQGRIPLDIRADHGFEVCCSFLSDYCTKNSGTWLQSPITSHDSSTVTLNTSSCHGHGSVHAVRYAWKESPCPYMQCAVYGRDDDLPGPPFYHSFS